uniref:Uncharacterized protein n=1 Tax=Manihot esculenta TaxID=3983 RepID=A0A2C9V8H5_MANES
MDAVTKTSRMMHLAKRKIPCTNKSPKKILLSILQGLESGKNIRCLIIYC